MKKAHVTLIAALAGSCLLAGYGIGFRFGHQSAQLKTIVMDSQVNAVLLKQLDAGDITNVRTFLEGDPKLAELAARKLTEARFRVGEPFVE